MAGWISESLAFLTSSQRSDGGWSYFAEGESALEPTAIAVAALWAHGGDVAMLDAGQSFIVGLQGSDGSMRPEPSTPDPTTLGALGALVIAACAKDAAPARRAADYLLSYDPIAPARDARSPIADDSSLKGFAWRPRTYSWVEPTAYAMILMFRLGRGSHPRVAEGRRMMLDRAVPTGGWNYGNSAVFKTPLESAVMPTALALLALWDDSASNPVKSGIEYLHKQPSVPSALSLAWMYMALAARGLTTPSADQFGELFAASKRSARSPWHRAAALLAAAAVEKNPFVIRGVT